MPAWESQSPSAWHLLHSDWQWSPLPSIQNSLHLVWHWLSHFPYRCLPPACCLPEHSSLFLHRLKALKLKQGCLNLIVFFSSFLFPFLIVFFCFLSSITLISQRTSVYFQASTYSALKYFPLIIPRRRSSPPKSPPAPLFRRVHILVPLPALECRFWEGSGRFYY